LQSAKVISLMIFLVFSTSACACATDRIKVLAVGMVAPGSSPIPGWLETEPALSGGLIPNRYAVGVFELEDAKRMVRIYFPRTEKGLADYDIIVFSGGCVRGFDLSQAAMVESQVSRGMAALTDIGGVSSSADLWNEWLSLGMDRLFPNDVRAMTSGPYRDDMPFRIEVSDSADLGEVLRVFVPLGIENVPGFNAYLLIPLQGAKVWAVTRGNWPGVYPRPPWLMSWKYNKGFTWALADAFTFEFWSGFYARIGANRYALDIFVNMILEATGRDLPDDIMLVHSVRQNLRVYGDAESTLYEVVDFLEQLGANTRGLNGRIVDIKRKRNSAEEAYLSQDYELANLLIDEALGDAYSIRDSVEKLRKTTMFWIFLTEWSVVSATLMAAGSALYWLMIRRRLYRQVATTRRVG